MTRDQIVSYVTQKTQQIEPNDVSACQTYVSARYELIYNSQLWKDSLIIVPVTFDPVNNTDNAEGFIILPESIERVVAVRTDCNSVRVNNMQHYFRIDYDAFNAGNQNAWGGACEFALLNPVWFVWHGYRGLKIFVSDPTDGAVPFKVTWVDAGGNRFVVTTTSQSTITGPQTGTATDTAAIVVTGSSIAGVNDFYTMQNGAYINQSQNPAQQYTIEATFSGVPATAFAIVLASNDVSDPATWLYKGPSVVGPWTVATAGNLPVPVSVYAPSSRLEIESFFKPVTKGPVSLIPLTSGDPIGGTLNASDTRSPKRARVRIFAVPSGTRSINVLGKKPFTPLDYGSEVPALKNVTNCLIAFATAEMLERGRQYAKAQAKNQEAMALLKDLTDEEAIQEANHEQIIPSNGYGEQLTGPNRGTYGYLYQ